MNQKYLGKCMLYYSYEIKDKNGKVKEKSEKIPAKSFVKQYLQWLYYMMTASYMTSMKDTGGTIRTLSANCEGYIEESASSTNYGLVVGSSNTAIDIENYSLASKITHGSGSGQLLYGNCVKATPSTTAAGTTMKISRDFSNGYVDSIIIYEVGMNVRVYNGSAFYYFLFARDIPTPITLDNGDQLTLNYIFETTV